MAYASSHQGYSTSAVKYSVSGSAGSTGSSGSTATNLYAVKMNPVCCGSFSRGQRCGGCPGK